MDESDHRNSTQSHGFTVLDVEKPLSKHTIDVPSDESVPENFAQISTSTQHGSGYPLLAETSTKTRVYIVSVKSGKDYENPAHQVSQNHEHQDLANASSISPFNWVATESAVQYVVKSDGSFKITGDQQVPVKDDFDSPTADSEDDEPLPKTRKIDEEYNSVSQTEMQPRGKHTRVRNKPRRFVDSNDLESEIRKKATISKSIKENSHRISLQPVHIDQVDVAELSFEIEMDDNLVLGQFEKLSSQKGKSVYKFNVAKAANSNTDAEDTLQNLPQLSEKNIKTEQIETETKLSCGKKFVKSVIKDSIMERAVKVEIDSVCSDNDQKNEEIDFLDVIKHVMEEERLKKEEQEIDEADASDDYMDITEEDSKPSKKKQKSNNKTASAVKKHDPSKPKRQNIRGRWKEVLDEYDYSPHYTVIKQKKVRGDKQVTRCNICDKYESNNLCNMKEHIRGHTGLKPFVCQYCNKSFHSQSYHLKHERGHLNIRPFVCEICHLSFKEKRYLEVHTNRHLGHKNYVCHVCTQSFYTITELKIHSDKHSDMKRYECPICEKKFRNSSSYYRHKLLHTSAGRYQCDLCGKTFHRKEYYVVHLQKQHADVDVKSIIEAIPNKRNNYSVRKFVPIEECDINYSETSANTDTHLLVLNTNADSQTDNEDGLIIVKNEIGKGSVDNGTGMNVEEGAIVYQITIPKGGSGLQYVTVHNGEVQ